MNPLRIIIKRIIAFICSVFALFFDSFPSPSKPINPIDPSVEQVEIVNRNVIGAGGYGAVFNAQIDPFDESCYAFSCDMGGVYFSYDYGENFQRSNVRGTAGDLRFDPSTPGVVWAVGSGVYKSTDHGKSFNMVFPKQEDIYSYDHNFENGSYWIFAKDENGVKSDYIPQFQMWSVCINRNSNGQNVYVAQKVSAWDSTKGLYIYETTDGENFHFFKKLDYSENFKLEYDEVNDCLIVAVSNNNDLSFGKIYEIDRAGNIAYTLNMSIKIHHGVENTLAFSGAYDKEKNLNTYCFSAVTSENGKKVVTCYKTNDLRNPESFINLTEKLYNLRVKDLQVNVGFLYREDWKADGEINDYASNEYYEWLNSGPVLQTFDWDIETTSVVNENIIYLYHENYVDVKRADGTSYGLNRRTLAYLKYDETKPEKEQFKWVFGLPHKATDQIVNGCWQDGDSGFCFGFSSSPTNENALIFGTAVGLYNTVDGENIYQLQSHIIEQNYTVDAVRKDGFTIQKQTKACATSGVDVYCTHKVATDPFDNSHLLMGCTDFGILQSYDNGESWLRLVLGWDNDTFKYTDPAYRNTCFDIHFDKEKKGVVYSVWTNVQYAPYSPGGGYLTAKGKFAVSYDGGVSWDYISIREDDNVIPYKMQVEYDGDRRIIYLATANRGFYVSYDSGETFQEFNNGIAKNQLSGTDVIYGNDIIKTPMGIFAIVCGSASSNTSAMYKWNEETSSFESIPLPYRIGALRDLEYDENNNCLYIGAIARSLDNTTRFIKDGGGVWKYSADGTFTQMYDNTRSVFSVGCDGTGRLYAVDLYGRLVQYKNNNTEYNVLCEDLFSMPANVDFGGNDVIYIITWGGGTEKFKIKPVSSGQ